MSEIRGGRFIATFVFDVPCADHRTRCAVKVPVEALEVLLETARRDLVPVTFTVLTDGAVMRVEALPRRYELERAELPS